MKQNTSKTVAIKCSESNEIHKLLNPNPCKRSEAWRKENQRKPLTQREKIALFDQIVLIDKQKSEELSRCKFKQREKKRVNKLRNERNAGKPAKRKTTKTEWEAKLAEYNKNRNIAA